MYMSNMVVLHFYVLIYHELLILKPIKVTDKNVRKKKLF